MEDLTIQSLQDALTALDKVGVKCIQPNKLHLREPLTLRQAAYLVASEELARAKDWEYALWADPKVPRSAVKKAKLEVHAAELRAARLIAAKSMRDIPRLWRSAIECKLHETR